MRPVKRQFLTHRPAEQRIDRNAKILCLQIKKRVFYRSDRLLVYTAWRLARDGVKRRRDQFRGPWILADQRFGHPPDGGGQAGAAIALIVFRPSDESVVGRDFQKREVPPARIAVQILDPGDLHPTSPSRAPAR